MSHSSVYCNLCSRVIEKRNEIECYSRTDGNNSTYSWLALSRNQGAIKKLFENHSVDKVKKLYVVGH